jgi:hypothetical protein
MSKEFFGPLRFPPRRLAGPVPPPDTLLADLGNASTTGTGPAFVNEFPLFVRRIGLNGMTSMARATVTRSSPKRSDLTGLAATGEQSYTNATVTRSTQYAGKQSI